MIKLREKAISIVFLGICAAWLEFFVPAGKLRSAAAFTLGVLLLTVLLQCFGAAAEAITLPEISLDGTVPVSQSDAVVSLLADAECSAEYAADGSIRNVRVMLPDGAEAQRIRTLLSRIYSVEEDQIILMGR